MPSAVPSEPPMRPGMNFASLNKSERSIGAEICIFRLLVVGRRRQPPASRPPALTCHDEFKNLRLGT